MLPNSYIIVYNNIPPFRLSTIFKEQGGWDMIKASRLNWLSLVAFCVLFTNSCIGIALAADENSNHRINIDDPNSLKPIQDSFMSLIGHSAEDLVGDAINGSYNISSAAKSLLSTDRFLKEVNELASQGSERAKFQQYLNGFTSYSNKKESPLGSYDEAVKLLRKEAESGYAEAQYQLSIMYGIKGDNAEAIKWVRKAAEQGHANSQCHLGNAYHSGDGVVKDYKEAAFWYQQAAEKGDAEAERMLGVMYLDGQGVPQNNNEAFYWTQLAANQGNAIAENNLGAMYLQGIGVKQGHASYVEGAKWQRKAAEDGDATALFLFCVNYEGVVYDGDKAVVVGDRHSNVAAYCLCSAAAKRGFESARKEILAIVTKMTQEEIEDSRAILEKSKSAKEIMNLSEAYAANQSSKNKKRALNETNK
jgi:TPR repeat protein